MKNCKYLVTVISFLSLNNAFCNLKMLSQTDQKKVQNGEMVLIEKPYKNSPWPERFVFKIVKMSALESMAVFSAFNYQKEYVPDVLYSKVFAQASPLKADVKYIREAPWPLSNIEYSQRHELKKRGDQYILFWNQLKSTSTKQNFGSASFKKIDDHHSLFVYQSLINPDSVFASLFKSTAKNDLIKTIQVIIKHIESLKGSKKLEELKNQLSLSLKGKYIYIEKNGHSKNKK